ncbi:MAG: transposase, partial [Nitrospirota bacterium]|nr:transposase [Nitrospirota bacterium]
MARYKSYSYEQSKFISIYFDEQLLPGTFEYALNHIVDKELDLSIFLDRYKNDLCGATAYDPAILLKIVFFAYSHGITSSRKIEASCRHNILFKALSADTVPHYTTIADFISSMEVEITPLFRNVLLICDEMGLIGKEMFAIDGCKLPSNASKEWSGTHADLAKKKEKVEKVIGHILKRHRAEDQQSSPSESTETKREKQLTKLRKKSKKIKQFLEENEDRTGTSGKVIKSNITDNESAKMPSSHGVIQGYNGIAAADE